MNHWWRKGFQMKDYVTQGHFDATIGELRKEFVSKTHFDEVVERLVTKDEFHTRMDEVITILRRLDQERLFMFEWVKRIDTDVTRIKGHLKLA